MAFIRKRGRSYYKVEAYRNKYGKPRQRVLACLGDKSPKGPHRGLRGSMKKVDGDGD